MAAFLKASAGIPERYERCSFRLFETSHPKKAMADQLARARSLAERYADEFLGDDGRHRDSGLLFTGPAGTGKTHLAVAVLVELMQRYGVRGRFIDFTTLIYAIQSTFDPGSVESKRQVLDPIIEAEVLVLDELGAQKLTPFVMDTLYLVVNTRYTERRPTLFTTNYRLEPASGKRAVTAERIAQEAELLEGRIGIPLTSRLYDMAQPVVLDAVDDYRRGVKHARHRVEA